MKLVLTNANLIDCITPTPIPGASITVEDGRIVEVLNGSRSPSLRDARLVDLKGSYLLPGLWDVQVQWPHSAGNTVPKESIRFGYSASQALTEGGVVGLRTAGVPQFIDVAWREAFNSGQFVGPRIYASGNYLTTTGGHALGSGFAIECDGPYGWVNAIRDQIKNGVDQIKLDLTGGVLGPSWDRHWHSFLLEEEMEAAFAICRQRGYNIMAHASNPDAIKPAILLGARSIEHGYILDDETVELMVRHGIYYVPTLCLTHMTPDKVTTPWEKRWMEENGWTPEIVRRLEDAADVHRQWFQRALEAGVKMVTGSNLTPLKEGVLLEMGVWEKNGATAWQTLLAATRIGAEVSGAGQDLGTVEVGKLADLIVVADNPLENINNLRSLDLVIKEGSIVADHRKNGSGPA